MSFFISSMPLDGLMSRPPRVEATPLPTSVTFGASVAPPDEVDEARRLGAGAADRVDRAGRLRSISAVAAGHFDAGAEFFGEARRLAAPARPARDRWRAC